MGGKCKIPIFHLPLFQHEWAQNTLESGLNVMEYHCGLRKKRFIKFGEVSQNFNFFGSASLLYAPHLDHQSAQCEFQ